MGNQKLGHCPLSTLPQSTSPPTGVGDQELGHCPQGHSDYTHHLPRGLSQPGPRLLQLAQALTTSWARLSPACSGSIKGQPRQRQDCPLGTGGPPHPWDLTTLALFHSSLRPALLTSGTHISFFVVQSLSCVRLSAADLISSLLKLNRCQEKVRNFPKFTQLRHGSERLKPRSVCRLQITSLHPLCHHTPRSLGGIPVRSPWGGGERYPEENPSSREPG